MKCILKTWLTLFAVITAFPLFANPGRGQFKKSSSIDSLLTAHQWTLVEILQKKDDAVTNMTSLMMPCEKDNFLQYSSRGTYQILEGNTKCNDADNHIKGQGTWQYDQKDSSLVERYEGGSWIPKRIKTINDEKLVLQYQGEGKRDFILTFLSEKGQQNKTEENLVADDSDPSQYLLQFITEYLLSTNRYTLVDKKELNSGLPEEERKKNNAMKTVALLPFNSVTEEKGSDKEEQTKALIEQAARSGIDYVITGNVMEAMTSVKDNKNFIGTVKFDIMLIDVRDTTQRSQIFNRKHVAKIETNGPKKTPFWKAAVNEVVKAVPGVLKFIGLTRYSYNDLYTAVVVSDAVTKTYETATLFSNANSVARQRSYDSTTTVVTAVSESKAEVQQFIADHVTPKIKINRLEGAGKKAKLVIEAGSNIYLQKDEELKVVRIIRSEDAGKVIKERIELGKIKVEEITADVRSYCSITKGADNITEAYTKAPQEIIVITTIQKPRDDKK